MRKFENRILKDLYESVNGLYSFTFYSRYKVEPKVMFEIIEKYTSKGIISYDDDRLELTENGRKLIFTHIYFNKTTKGIFSNIPQSYEGKKIEINQPYLPKLNYLSPEIIGIVR